MRTTFDRDENDRGKKDGLEKGNFGEVYGKVIRRKMVSGERKDCGFNKLYICLCVGINVW